MWSRGNMPELPEHLGCNTVHSLGLRVDRVRKLQRSRRRHLQDERKGDAWTTAPCNLGVREEQQAVEALAATVPELRIQRTGTLALRQLHKSQRGRSFV